MKWRGKAPFLAALLLAVMAALAGGAASRESVTVDEVAHLGAGVSYIQKLDLRLNEEHPPLAKVIAAIPVVLRGARADYTHASWTISAEFFPGLLGEWVFGEWLLTRWNDPGPTLAWARASMLGLMLALGWTVYVLACRLGGPAAGLISVSAYASAPVFLAFGPLVLTDVAVTLFALLTLWAFADLWREPSGQNVAKFALALAGALLSKFSAGILFVAFALFALSVWRLGVAGQPSSRPDARAWRRLRWRAVIRGIFWSAVVVYTFYFMFSWNQPTDSLALLGQGNGAMVLRRLLMPPWLYLRGLFMFIVTASRPTFVLGHAYPHGVWFYFPVLLVLKSPPGLLGLIALAALVALARRVLFRHEGPGAIPAERLLHWRVLWVSLIAFAAVCMLSRLNIGLRHFSVPLVLLILLLAPLPTVLSQLGTKAPRLAVGLGGLAAALALSSIATAVRAYPYYVPYLSPLSLGRPAYTLMNDSNLDWNQALPEVARFAREHGLSSLAIDTYGFTDPTTVVPGSRMWDCQTPSEAEAGAWVAVSANMLVDGHNCLWLMQYPHEPLAGGSMYVVRLPDPLPPAGSPGGPPPPSARREFAGLPFDMRSLFLNATRHPETIPDALARIQAAFQPPQAASPTPPVGASAALPAASPPPVASPLPSPVTDPR